jgi:uncharacterized protein YbaP (TraB family)
MMVFQTGLYGGDETLWDHVSPETRQRLEAFCEKYGLPAMAMSKMKPWAAAMMISTLPLMKSGMEMNWSPTLFSSPHAREHCFRLRRHD